MNPIDMAILFLMGISCLMGIVRGVTREVLGVFTWTGAGMSAYMTFPVIAPLVGQYITNKTMVDVIAGLICFILSLIFFSIITYYLSNTVRNSVMGSVDRGLGLAFGVVRGAVVICAIEIIFSLFVFREMQSETIKSARFIPMVQRGSDELITMLPSKVRVFLDQQSQKIHQETQKSDLIESQLIEPLLENASQNPSQSRERIQNKKNNEQGKKSILNPPRKEDPQEKAESLSKLLPQSVVGENKNEGEFDRRKQRELDRLIEASTTED